MEPLIRIALRVAREQSPLLVQTHERPPSGRFSPKGLEEYVHQLRTRLNATYHETVKTCYPDHAVSTDSQKPINQHGYFWFVEPLCGEDNFLRSLSDYCAVIGIYYHGSLHHAVVYHYLDDVEYYATKDVGAIVNKNRLRVSSTSTLARAVIAYEQPQSLPDLSQFHEKLRAQNLNLRSTGCVALDLAHVAQGKLDACIVVSTSQSITRATNLLVTEAGGFTSPISQSDSIFVAGNPQIYSSLAPMLLGSDSDSTLSRKLEG